MGKELCVYDAQLFCSGRDVSFVTVGSDLKYVVIGGLHITVEELDEIVRRTHDRDFAGGADHNVEA